MADHIDRDDNNKSRYDHVPANQHTHLDIYLRLNLAGDELVVREERFVARSLTA